MTLVLKRKVSLSLDLSALTAQLHQHRQRHHYDSHATTIYLLSFIVM